MTEQELIQLIAANAQAIATNAQAIAADREAMAEIRQEQAEIQKSITAQGIQIADLRAAAADFLEGQALLSQRFSEEQDRREEMRQDSYRIQRQILEIQLENQQTRQDIRELQSEVRGLQTQAYRILERMDRRDRGEE